MKPQVKIFLQQSIKSDKIFFCDSEFENQISYFRDHYHKKPISGLDMFDFSKMRELNSSIVYSIVQNSLFSRTIGSKCQNDKFDLELI